MTTIAKIWLIFKFLSKKYQWWRISQAFDAFVLLISILSEISILIPTFILHTNSVQYYHHEEICQLILLYKLIDWFIYDDNIEHYRVKIVQIAHIRIALSFLLTILRF